MRDFVEYDEDSFEPKCSRCGAENAFKRLRVLHEVEILDLEGGIGEIADQDTHDQDDWRYECDRCGATASELEDLLSEREDEPEENDDDGMSDPDNYYEYVVKPRERRERADLGM